MDKITDLGCYDEYAVGHLPRIQITLIANETTPLDLCLPVTLIGGKLSQPLELEMKAVSPQGTNSTKDRTDCSPVKQTERDADTTGRNTEPCVVIEQTSGQFTLQVVISLKY